MTMTQLFGILSLWLVLTAAEPWIEMPKWMWYLILVMLGIGWELLAEEGDRWWLAFGLAGGAVLFSQVTDLLLVLTDWVRMLVLRRTR
jgi:hypothetical protein